MNDQLNIVVAIAIPLALLGWGYGLPVWQASITPSHDIPRIKRSLDGQAHRVTRIHRRGSDWEMHRRGATSYRVYAVEIEYPDKTRSTRLIALQPSLLGDDRLYEYRKGVRCWLGDDI